MVLELRCRNCLANFNDDEMEWGHARCPLCTSNYIELKNRPTMSYDTENYVANPRHIIPAQVWTFTLYAVVAFCCIVLALVACANRKPAVDPARDAGVQAQVQPAAHAASHGLYEQGGLVR